MSRHHRRLLRRLRAVWGDGSRPRCYRQHRRWWVECDGCTLAVHPARVVAIHRAIAAVQTGA